MNQVRGSCAAVMAIALMTWAGACQHVATSPSRVWNATIGGSIATAVGLPVSGAAVTIQVLNLDDTLPVSVRGKCRGELSERILTTTNAEGRFSVTVQGMATPIHSCIFVDAIGISAGDSVVAAAEADSILIGPPPADAVSINAVAR